MQVMEGIDFLICLKMCWDIPGEISRYVWIQVDYIYL